MKIGIVGSSSLLSYDRFMERLSLILYWSVPDTIVAGNCPCGSDKLSERYARENKLKFESIPDGMDGLSEHGPCPQESQHGREL